MRLLLTNSRVYFPAGWQDFGSESGSRQESAAGKNGPAKLLSRNGLNE
jgi:hypothetical protein